jgi:death-on-curing protein
VKKLKEPLWIDERDALAIHDRLLGLHGGASGVRDQALLASALARPRQHHAYGGAPDIIGLAAIYTAAIIGNHPFVDGDRRTGFVVGIVFLELNGYRFTASEEDAAQAVLALAGEAVDETRFATWLRANSRRRR